MQQEEPVQESPSSEVSVEPSSESSEGTVTIPQRVECKNPACFEDKFSRCEPATRLYIENYQASEYYEIIGSEQGLCRVNVKNLDNPQYANQEMTCLNENTKDFETATKEAIDAQRCEGALYDALKSA